MNTMELWFFCENVLKHNFVQKCIRYRVPLHQQSYIHTNIKKEELNGIFLKKIHYTFLYTINKSKAKRVICLSKDFFLKVCVNVIEWQIGKRWQTLYCFCSKIRLEQRGQDFRAWGRCGHSRNGEGLIKANSQMIKNVLQYEWR